MTNPKRHRRSNKHHRRHSRRNPSVKHSKRKSYHRRRRNPDFGGFSANHLAKLGVGAAVGGWATRYIPQAVLGDGNTGVQGYLADVIAAIGLAWLAKKFAGADVADGVAAGGIAAVLLRVYSEKFGAAAPAALQGYMGDLEFSGDLGAYINSEFPVPTVSRWNGNYLSSGGASSGGGPGSSATFATGAGMGPAGAGAPAARWGASRWAM